MWVAAIILGLTYIGIAFTRLPFVNIDRPAAVLTGALLMVLFGVLTFQEAVQAIDFNTMALLLGMMLLIAVLQRVGFFTILASRSIALATSPHRLLIIVVLATAVASAFLVNDVVVLLFTPVIIRACHMLKTNPLPYLVAEAMASNIGSTATIVGNPQNMLIGVTSGIPFFSFFLYLLPVSALSTVVLIVATMILYRQQLAIPFETNHTREPVSAQTLAVVAGHDIHVRRRRILVLPVSVLVVTLFALFFSSSFGWRLPLVAMTAGVAAVLLSGIRPSAVIRHVDWVLLVFFGGLFVVIGGARQAGVLDVLMNQGRFTPDIGGILSMHLFSAGVSQIVSNVPLTMLTIPLIQHIPGDVLWIALAAGSTLGGNATLIGAIANIIVAEGAAREGVELKFGEFARLGLVVTVITIGISIGVLALECAVGVLR